MLVKEPTTEFRTGVINRTTKAYINDGEILNRTVGITIRYALVWATRRINIQALSNNNRIFKR